MVKGTYNFALNDLPIPWPAASFVLLFVFDGAGGKLGLPHTRLEPHLCVSEPVLSPTTRDNARKLLSLHRTKKVTPEEFKSLRTLGKPIPEYHINNDNF